MNETVQPTIPLLVTLLGYSLFVVWIVLLVVAVTTLVRADRVSPTARVLWVVLMIAMPVLGCVTWLVYYGSNRASLRPEGTG